MQDTTFILLGGNDRAYSLLWSRLAYFVQLEIDKPHILSCHFALEEKDRPETRYDAYRELFEKNFTHLAHLEFAREDDFYEQVASADVLFLHGGVTALLRQAIPDIERFKQAIRGKIVIGSSAGANFLSAINYSPSTHEVSRSNGVLPIAVIVHYGATSFNGKEYDTAHWNAVYEMIQYEASKTNTPVMLLVEGEMTILRTSL